MDSVDYTFEYVAPTPESTEHIKKVRNECECLYKTLLETPQCRERSVAITKLEEVSMWINKAIVMTQIIKK